MIRENLQDFELYLRTFGRYLKAELWSGMILVRKEKAHRLAIGVRLIQQAAAVEIDVRDVVSV
ncbi:MAG: hypothetical protein AB1555_19520 [Nitrospirota bacterium]